MRRRGRYNLWRPSLIKHTKALRTVASKIPASDKHGNIHSSLHGHPEIRLTLCCAAAHYEVWQLQTSATLYKSHPVRTTTASIAFGILTGVRADCTAFITPKCYPFCAIRQSRVLLVGSSRTGPSRHLAVHAVNTFDMTNSMQQ